MAQSKRIRAKKIREKIASSVPAEQNTAVAENVDVARGIEKIASFVEKLTGDQKKFFAEFLIEIKKISSSTQDFKKQQKLLQDSLTKASDILKNKAKGVEDDETQKKVAEVVEKVEKTKKTISRKSQEPRKPRTFKEKLANQQFKGNPDEVAKKGYFGALFSQTKREIFGGDEMLEQTKGEDKEQKSTQAEVKPLPKKTTKEKTQNNLKGITVLERKLSGILSEVTIIRKVVEGSLKYDAKLKGSPYYKEDAEGKKRSVDKSMARTAGVGLYTKDDLGEKLGLSKSEIKKKKISELEELAVKNGIIDLETNQQNEKLEKTKQTPKETKETPKETKKEKSTKKKKGEPRKPRTFKEKLAYQQFKGNPDEVAEKGYFGALFSQTKREIFGEENQEGEKLEGEENQEGEKLEKEQDAKNKKKGSENDSSLGTLTALLSEVTVIRKVVEGRMKFDPKLKGSQYYEEDAEGKKRSVDKSMARTAGVGLYTKDELGEKLGLSASEIKKKKLADLEETAAEDGKIDLQKKKEKSDFSFLVKNAEKSRDDWNEYKKIAEKQNDTNENLERSTAIDTNPSDEKRFTSSGSDVETPKETFAGVSNTKGGGGSDKGGSPFSMRNIKRGGRALLKGGRAAFTAGRTALSGAAGVMGTSVGAASGAAIGGTIVGGLAAGLAIGDQFNTSIADGGSGNLKDVWNYNIKGKSPEEEQAEKNADSVAQQKGFANFEEMKAANKKKRAASVASTKNNIANTIEKKEMQMQQSPAQNITNVTNNNYSGGSSQQKEKEKEMPVLPVRTSDTSFIRYQDKRMTRVL